MFKLHLLVLVILISNLSLSFADDESSVQKVISEGGSVEVTPTDQYVAEEESTFGVNPDGEAMLSTNTVTMLTVQDEKIVAEAAEALKVKRPDLSEKLKNMIGE